MIPDIIGKIKELFAPKEKKFSRGRIDREVQRARVQGAYAPKEKPQMDIKPILQKVNGVRTFISIRIPLWKDIVVSDILKVFSVREKIEKKRIDSEERKRFNEIALGKK